LEEILRPLYGLRELSSETLVHVIDILLVAYLIYRLLSLTRGSRAWRILGGIVAFVLLLFVSNWLQLTALHWILDKATLLAPVALVILLLPELRQALEGVGKLGFWPKRLAGLETYIAERTVDAIAHAAAELAGASVGALIVVEREASLDEVIATGVRLDARVSAPLLGSIFFDPNPLHDGAAIIRRDTLVAAACRLPSSENSRLPQNLHMRHRAAVGVTENNDCLAIVISEERGEISVASEGQLRQVSVQELRDLLGKELRSYTVPRRPLRPTRPATPVEGGRN
jgi:diadenylate cyclase